MALALLALAASGVSLPLLTSDELFASATSAVPLLLLFFFRSITDGGGDSGGDRGDGDGGGDGGGDELEGGAATAGLLSDMRALASRFEGLVAAVDCAHVPRVCARRRIVETPTLKLFRTGKYSVYTGKRDLASVEAFLRRKLLGLESEAGRVAAQAASAGPNGMNAAADTAREAARTKSGSSAARPPEDAPAGWARWAIDIAREIWAGRMLSDTHGLMLLGGTVCTALCTLVASACALRLNRARARSVARLGGRVVDFDGGCGLLTRARGPGVGEEDTELPAVVLVGPAAPSARPAQLAQQAALEALAARLGACGFRVLSLELGPHALIGERIAGLIAAAQWMRQDGAGRVGALGVGEGGALVARAARLAACPFDCCVAFELGAADTRLEAGSGAPQPALAQLSAAIAELGALGAGARTAVQVHIDLLHGPLSADRPPASAAEGKQREADTCAYAAAKLHAAAAKLRPSSPARNTSGSQLFVYGLAAPGADAEALAACLDALEEDDDADLPERDDAAAELEPWPLLLQPDGGREVAKGYALKRAVGFLHQHLTR